MRNIGYYCLFSLVYCACFFALYLVGLLILVLLSKVVWLYRVLSWLSESAPEYAVFTVAGFIATLPIYHLADRLDARGPAFALGLAVVVVNLGLTIYSIVISYTPALYSAQVIPAIALAVQERRHNPSR